MTLQQLQEITAEDYETALARIAAGEHMPEDENLVQAWEHRMVQEHQKTFDAIRRAVAAIEPVVESASCG